MVMCCPIACNFNGNSCFVLLLNKFPASCELLRVLPALGFCFDLSLCNLHLLIMRLILFPRIVSNSIKTMYNISSDQTRQKIFWWSGLFLDISNGCARWRLENLFRNTPPCIWQPALKIFWRKFCLTQCLFAYLIIELMAPGSGISVSLTHKIDQLNKAFAF